MPDPQALVAEAAAILDRAAALFIAGHRAASAVQKKGNDFATDVDLALERQLVTQLESATGIAVHGEEFGGADLNSEWVWVVDPIDGTFNYAAGSPMASILVALLRRRARRRPHLAALHRPALHRGGGRAADVRRRRGAGADAASLSDAIVGVGSFNVLGRGRYLGRWRPAVFSELAGVLQIRMHGSIGIDMAYVGAWDSRRHNPFRRACLGPRGRRGAGASRRGVVTDLAGGRWTPDTRGYWPPHPVRTSSCWSSAPGRITEEFR